MKTIFGFLLISTVFSKEEYIIDDFYIDTVDYGEEYSDGYEYSYDSADNQQEVIHKPRMGFRVLDDQAYTDLLDLTDNIDDAGKSDNLLGIVGKGGKRESFGLTSRGRLSDNRRKLSENSIVAFQRKKWLKYGEYAGGFQNFDRDNELDLEDEVDLKIKELKSLGNHDTNEGDGWGHIGKGSENLNAPLVKFHKYKMIKSMTMYLQDNNKQFGKYIGYGCWCLAAADMALGEPTGKAVDAIDQACRDYHHCNRCLKIDYPTLDNELSCNMFRGYRFKGNEDRNKERSISCNNNEGSCQHTICSCDARLAETFQKLEDTWNINFHSSWGGFNRQEKCFARNSKLMPKADKCCGTKPHRFPFNSMNGQKSCCGEKTFSKTEGCCTNNELRSVTECGNNFEDFLNNNQDEIDNDFVGEIADADLTNPFQVIRPTG